MALSEYDPIWSEIADQWMNQIRQALGHQPARIEHIGSTSVVGLQAKPVVDIQVSVPDIADEASYRPALESLGLVLRLREEDHDFFRPPAGETRTVHVHVCEIGSPWEQEKIRFRDRLRADPELVNQYAALKRKLLVEADGVRAAYTQGKTDFILEAIK